MDIKKDKKGMVVVQGAEIKTARNVKELGSLFEEGSKSRHVASTSKWPYFVRIYPSQFYF